MYEPITVEIDRGYGEEGIYHSHTINFTGSLIQHTEKGYTTMRLYEWADYRDDVVYLVHVQEDKPGRFPRRTLYPFIYTHEGLHRPGGFSSLPGIRQRDVCRASPNYLETPVRMA